jgi:lysine biosynthesis protein LysW
VATCPERSGIIPIAEEMERGAVIPFPVCGAELEARALEPLTLTPAPEIQEDLGE